MENEHPSTGRRTLTLLRIVSYAGAAVGAVLLVCVLALLFFPGPLVNRFVKPRITEAFAKACPAWSLSIAGMNYSVLKNRFGFDSVAVRASNGTMSATVGSFSVSGFRWMHLLWGGKPALNDLASSAADAHDIALNFPRLDYELRCERLVLSIPDSELVAESLTFHPLSDDEQLFAASRFRTTRFRLVAPRVRVLGLACLELLQGKNYRTRSAELHDSFFDILINKDKPYDSSAPSPMMPSEALASIKGTLQVDSLSLVNGRLKYCERYVFGAEPAVLTFDSVQMLAEGVANHGDRGAALVVHAEAKFMKAGTMSVAMTIPVASPEFSFQYSGSLSGMDISALNPWLETAEQIRIKGGVLQAASFKIDVDSGRASGSVRAVYRDLTLAAINKDTRSEKGFSDRIASFIANTLKLRGTNVPDKSGSMKIGEVNWTRKRDEFFTEFSWFALRSGVGDVVGF